MVRWNGEMVPFLERERAHIRSSIPDGLIFCKLRRKWICLRIIESAGGMQIHTMFSCRKQASMVHRLLMWVFPVIPDIVPATGFQVISILYAWPHPILTTVLGHGYDFSCPVYIEEVESQEIAVVWMWNILHRFMCVNICSTSWPCSLGRL